MLILFVARIPPNPAGTGGCQRAMKLLEAISKFGTIDFLLLYRDDDLDASADTLGAVRPLVRNFAKLNIAEWAAPWRRWPRLSWRVSQVLEMLAIYTVEAPRFSNPTLREIASLLPSSSYDLVFATRLSSATIVRSLLRAKLLTADRKVVDLDDRLSRVKSQFLKIEGKRQGRLRRQLQRIEIRRLRSAERRTACEWDAVSFASNGDAEALTSETKRVIATVPNVVDLAPLYRLPPTSTAEPKVLFVGHLGYRPNVLGLLRFLEEAWPLVRTALPNARLDVVGMYPDRMLSNAITAAGGQLHKDVPDVKPFYGACDVVIAPIFLGGGTRIKILEAMAFCRPIVSTSFGVEGLSVQSGRHALIEDDMTAFAAAIGKLARDPALSADLVKNARALQQARFSISSLRSAIGEMVLPRTST